MNPEKPSKSEEFRILYEATYSKRLDAKVAAEMLSQIRRKCNGPTLPEIRNGMESIASQYGKFDGPAINQLVTAITKVKGLYNSTAQQDGSRQGFIRALRKEESMSRRATMIFNCGDAYVPQCDLTGGTYDVESEMVENTCRLHVNSKYATDAVREALILCENNGIRHGAMNRSADAPEITIENRKAVLSEEEELEEAYF